MITKAKLIFDIANIMKGGVTSDDDRVSQRQIGFWIDNTRAQLIRQDLMKGRSISDNIVQSLNCVNVEQVDATDCCGITTDCITYRTTVTIPLPIETGGADLITKIGPLAVGERPFMIVPMGRIPYIGYSPFKGINSAIRAVYDGGYVYIFSPDKDRVITKINIEGVFSEPEQLSTFNNCSGDACYTVDSLYPISAHMIETMKQMIISTNGKVITQSPSDNRGDGNFEVQPNITK